MLLAFVIIPTLFSINLVKSTDTGQLSANDSGLITSRSIADRLYAAAYSEELNSSASPRITHSNGSRRFTQLKTTLFTGWHLSFLLSALAICISVWQLNNDILFSRRSIIKFIHDQDGQKD